MAGYRPLGINSVAPAIASISQFSVLYCTPDEPGGMRVALLNRNIAIIRSVSHSTISTIQYFNISTIRHISTVRQFLKFSISQLPNSPLSQFPTVSIRRTDVKYCTPDEPGGMRTALE